MTGPSPRAPLDIDRLHRALSDGLLPIVRIAGEETRRPMAQRLADYGCPAVGVAVMDQAAVAWSGGFGCVERGGSAADGGTVFAGASISKPVAAVLALQQVERGVLDLDADVNRYLSAWKVPDNVHTRQHPVTLRHLLSHRAGTTVHGFGGQPPGAPQASTLDTLLGRPPAATPAVTVDKTPGGAVRYSGGGYTVVQLVLEETCSRPFAQLAREMIFDPLGMSSSSFEAPLPPDLMARAATGHDDQGMPLPGRISVCAQSAAGGLYTTASDYARFMGAFRDAYVGRSEVLLKAQTARTAVDSRGPHDFGLGWRVLGQGATLRIAHGGSNEGYQCETTCYLADGRGAVVLTNAVSGAMLYWEVLNTIAYHADWPGFLREPKALVPLDEAQRRQLAGTYPIVSGVDAPAIEVAEKDGHLLAHIVGHRAPPLPVLMDGQGRLFNRFSPFETTVLRAEDGRALELVVHDGATEILRARRALPAIASAPA